MLNAFGRLVFSGMVGTILVGVVPAADSTRVPTGTSQMKITVDGIAFDVFTHRPASYKDGPLLVVCHGHSRNASGYRDYAIKLADRHGMLLIAPLFDEARFPTQEYNRGGIIKKGEAVPADKTTYAIAQRIIDEVRRREGRADMPYYLIGHSAGGQFLTRWAAFGPLGAARIVAANPGSHLFVSGDLPFPYGFNELPSALRSDEVLKRYLGAPLTFYLGSADVKRDSVLDVSATADKQGQTRWERGHKAFELGKKLADERGWEFNWKLVEVEGIGHSGSGMLESPTASVALFGRTQDRQKGNAAK